MTIPDARIEAARRYAAKHDLPGWMHRMIDLSPLGYPEADRDHAVVLNAILLGEVTPVEEGAEDGG